jgi:subfamily B ATP-binding cassette protein MsbA
MTSLADHTRWLVGLSRPHARRLVVALVLSMVGAGVGVLFPLGIRALVDTVLIEGGSTARLDLIAGLLLALFAVQSAAAFGGSYWLRWVGERVVADLRVRVYDHVHSLGLPYFMRASVGAVTSRLTSDVAAVRQAATGSLVAAVRIALTLTGSIALMVALNWRLSLVVLLVMPASTLASRAFGTRLRTLARRVQDALASSNTLVEEALAAIRVVKSYGQSDREVLRFERSVGSVFEAARQSGLLSAALSVTVGLLFYASIVAVVWFGGREVIAGRLSPGDLVAFIFYGLSVAQGLGDSVGLYASYSQAAGASERLRELLAETPSVDAPPHPHPPPTAGQVELQNVGFTYSTDAPPALRGVSLSVAPGETVAIVGPSGSGKTTLLHLLMRFYDPTTGDVRVDGTDVRGFDPVAYRKSLALVDQDIQLFGASVRDNIRYGRPDATDAEVELAAVAAEAHDFISSLPEGYDTVLGPRGARLSGGQRQRLSIARALLVDPVVLLMDEATAALDAETELEVRSAVTHLRDTRTTIVVTHRMSTVREADRVVVLDGGRVAEVGPHADLINAGGRYAELVAASTAPAHSASPDPLDPSP